MRKKILVLGSAGMAGHVIMQYLRKFEDKLFITDIARSSKYISPSIQMDITNFNELEEIIEISSFDYIINCIGLLTEKSKDRIDNAILVNSYLPRFLESITSKSQTKIIQISTDCVFSGTRGGYFENDFKDGNDIYSKTKSLGEIINCKDITIRTSIIGPELNPDGVGLFNWFLKSEGEIKGFTNVYWSGVTTPELAKFIHRIIFGDKLVGLIHLTNNEKISKYKILKSLKKIFYKNNLKITKCNKYKFDKSIINSRNDLKYNLPTYETMFEEMKEWIR